MLTRRQIQLIHSLKQKKFRDEYNLFLVEGEKSVQELLASNLHIKGLFITQNSSLHNLEKKKVEEIQWVSDSEMERISCLSSPSPVLAVVDKPTITCPFPNSGIHLLLDQIADPGNLGTLIRIADWFGIKSIYLTPGCVDVFSPKVVQSSMGSLFRIPCYTIEVPKFLSNISIPIIATVLDGGSLSETTFPSDCVLALGSESHGLSELIIKSSSMQISIEKGGNAESLNVAVAAGILLYQLTRPL